MPARTLPSEIGATENALRSLLTRTLAGTAVGTYERWVFLNVRDAYADDAAVTRAAEILKGGQDDAAGIQTQLSEDGLLHADGSLAAAGAEALATARRLVGAATAPLTEGLPADQLDAAHAVLEAIRTRAEAQLRG